MKKLSLGVVFLIFALLAACSNQENSSKQQEEPKEIETEEPATEEQPEEKKEEPTYDTVYPLTGEPAENEAAIENRVISVMVNNHSKARPQTGLYKADVVYEVLAEGMITRFLALFHSDIPDRIGPVRSARPYYFEIANGYDAVYVYHGAANFINDMIRNDGINFLDGAHYDNDGKLFKRSNDRRAPHNSYLLTGGIGDRLESKGYESTKTIEPLPFKKADGEVNGEEAASVKVVYHEREYVTFTYDEAEGKYLRSSDGQPSVDKEDQSRIGVENVFVVETAHQVYDSAGRRKIDLKSGGNGYLFQKGQKIEVTWKNIDGRILPFKDGEAVGFVPGQTWVNIVPESPGIKQSVSYN
ncbi:DUF3048 domain-containing protein [Thalassobacillus hwangdonensis]|uniref:DUF3048 domain-containing protein n=1 Tax=Thalassobacillus hwangdonensis TaxID=546108 RepID=A0ABW3L7J5_9BACI